MSDKQRPMKKTIFVAAILSAGLIAATFAITQMTASAIAQPNDDDGGDDPAVATMTMNGNQTMDLDLQPEATVISAVDENQRSTLSTFGRAMVTTQPDKFSVTVGVETTGTTAQEAASNNALQIAEIVQALRELGIEDEQMSTSQYSLHPIYEEIPVDPETRELIPVPPDRGFGQEIIGYRAFNSLSVTLDSEGEVEAGQVIDTAIEAGATNVNSMFFFVSQEMQQQIRNSLIVDAIADARERADIAADALGIQIVGVHSVSLDEVHFPIPFRGLDAPAIAEAAAPTPIMPGEQEVTSTVSITYYISSDGTVINNNNDNAEAENGVEDENGSDEELDATE